MAQAKLADGDQAVAPHLVTEVPGPRAREHVMFDHAWTSPSLPRAYPLVLGAGKSAVRVCPPLVIDEATMASGLAVLEEALQAVSRATDAQPRAVSRATDADPQLVSRATEADADPETLRARAADQMEGSLLAP